MSPEFQQRFGGIARLYGSDALARFQGSHVVVIGIGGVGSWAAEALARSGVGEISLFDMDDICITNTNRQIHALGSSVGKMKVQSMADRLRDINPELSVHSDFSFVTAKNVQEKLLPDIDYVFDATDSVSAKTAIIAHCVRHKIRVITSGGAGGQLDPTRISVADLSKTIQDPLLAKVRNHLRRHHGFTRNPKRRFRVDAVFSSEVVRYDQGDGTVCLQRPESAGPVKLDCASGFGAATHITATFGFVAVSKILSRLALDQNASN